MLKWFLCQNEEIEGPFTTEEVKTHLDSGRFTDQWLIWGQPLQEWKQIQWWNQALPQLLSQAEAKRNDSVWHYVHNEISHGPMDREQLVHELSQIENKSDIHVWTKGMKSWAPIFDCPDIMDEAGVSRRKHPRASIRGQAVIQVGDQEYIGQWFGVSAGGCSVKGFDILSVGQVLNISLRSDNFHQPISAKVEVRYISDNGMVGLKFVSLGMEEKANIIDYVRDQVLRSDSENQKVA